MIICLARDCLNTLNRSIILDNNWINFTFAVTLLLQTD